MPVYGSLTHTEERALQLRDPFAWCQYVAPWWRAQFLLFGEAAVNSLWPVASESLRRAIWTLCDTRLRTLIRKSRAGMALKTESP